MNYKRKIGIVGLGAIGSLMTKLLCSNSENELFFFTRTPKKNVSIHFEQERYIREVKCEEQAGFEEKLDWVFICLKKHQYSSAHQLFQKLISPNTKVVVIRNGLALTDDMLPYAHASNILPCLMYCAIQPQIDGSYICFNQPKIVTIKNTLALEFLDLLVDGSIEIQLSKDFKTESWKKLIESASIGGIQCKYQQPSLIFSDQRILSECIDLVRESIRVAKADGALLANSFEVEIKAKIIGLSPQKGSSMLTDLLNGNKVELDAKNRAIVLAGRKHNIPTPLNEAICTLLS